MKGVVDIVDISYSCYICLFQVKIISETNLNNFSGRQKKNPPEERRQNTMKIKITRENMLKALQKVGNIVNTRNTLPVLSNILFEAADGKLKLTGTDLEIRMETEVEAEVIEAGSTTLPAKKMLTLVSKFRGESIEIESGENFHSIQQRSV